MALYKKCPDCGSNLDPGEICDCIVSKVRAASDGEDSSRKRLLDWAAANKKEYPALADLREQKIKFSTYLILTAKWGRYDGIILTLDKNVALNLRKNKNNYAVGLVKDYDEKAKKYILECVKWNKQYLEI